MEASSKISNGALFLALALASFASAAEPRPSRSPEPLVAAFPFSFWKTSGATPTPTPGPFDPSSIGALRLWLKADALALSDGASVSSWTDSSSFANHLTQATGANQPIFKTAILNGKPVVRFDGSNDMLKTTSWTYPASFTLFFVFKPTAIANAYTSIYDSYQNTGGTFGGSSWLLKSSGKAAFYMVAGNGSQPSYDGNGVFTFATGTAAIVTIQSVSTVFTVWRNGNGNLEGTITHNAGLGQGISTPGLSVGASYLYAGRYLNGDIAEFIVYDATLSLADRRLVESYLGTKYGITVAP